jgi:hypothetical protein
LPSKHKGLVPVSHKNIIYPAVGKEQTAKGGVLYEGGCSAVGYKLVVCHIVPDRMGKRGGEVRSVGKKKKVSPREETPFVYRIEWG